MGRRLSVPRALTACLWSTFCTGLCVFWVTGPLSVIKQWYCMMSSKHSYLQPKLCSCYFCGIRKQINTHFELQHRPVTSDHFSPRSLKWFSEFSPFSWVIRLTLKGAALVPVKRKACFQKAPLLPECDRYRYPQQIYWSSGSCNNLVDSECNFLFWRGEGKKRCFSLLKLNAWQFA